MVSWNEILSGKVTKQIAEDLKAKGQTLAQNHGIRLAATIHIKEMEDEHESIEIS